MNAQKERMSQQGNSLESHQKNLTCDQALSQAIWMKVSRVTKITQKSPASIIRQKHIFRCQREVFNWSVPFFFFFPPLSGHNTKPKAHRATFLSPNQGLLFLWSVTGSSTYTTVIIPVILYPTDEVAWANSLSEQLDNRKRWQIHNIVICPAV